MREDVRQPDVQPWSDPHRVVRRTPAQLSPHAFAEEAVLWPVMRRVLPDGQELTLQVEREHQEVNELVTALETLEASDPAREPVLARLVEVLREDVRDEEDVLLPRLQKKLGRARLRGLGLAWEVVRRTAPTRAHPVVARRPPGSVVAAVPLLGCRGALSWSASERRPGGSDECSLPRCLVDGLRVW